MNRVYLLVFRYDNSCCILIYSSILVVVVVVVVDHDVFCIDI